MALSTASLLVAGLELGWFSGSDQTIVAVVLVAFAFPLQMLASIFGFLGRDTAAASGFGVQGATWLVVGVDLLLSSPGTTSHALGVLLLAASTWILLCALGSALGKLVPASVLLLTALRFLITGLYELTANRGLEHAAAITGTRAGGSRRAMQHSRLRLRTSSAGPSCRWAGAGAARMQWVAILRCRQNSWLTRQGSASSCRRNPNSGLGSMSVAELL